MRDQRMSNVEGIRVPIGYEDIPSHELFTCEPPSVIYHYTDYDGAKGIIESKSLWLTKLSYLNDIKELKLAIDLFRESAAEWAKKIDQEEKREFLDKTAHQLQYFQNTNIGVASFCENGDLLSQWRSYCNGDSGVALEFNARSFKSLSNLGLNLWRCVYLPQEQKTIIDGLINILLMSYDVINSTGVSGENREKTKSDIMGYFTGTFLQVAPVIKDSHYYEEKEWRIITRSTSSTDENWFPMISNNRIYQYYRVDFNLIDHGTYEFLEGIIIGPTNEPTQISDAFRVLLHKAGYKHKHFKYSQIPYRSK